MQEIKQKLSTLDEHGGIKKIARISAAYGDEKYILTAVDNERFLLKKYTLNRDCDVQADKEINNRISETGIKTPLILEVGKTEKDLVPFELLIWIPGKSLDQQLDAFPKELQYLKGVATGRILKNIHTLDYYKLCRPNHTPLTDRVKNVIEGYDLLKRNGRPTYKGDVFRDYILKTSYAQSEGNVCLLHGDYHAGNIIEGVEGALWVIDWIYNLIGDPIEDFVRIFVSADKSPEFAKGQIDGYFDRVIPLCFWHKLKMYAAIQQLEMLFYPLGKLSDGRTLQEHQHHIVYEQYYGMKSIIPQFYTETGGIENEH